MPQEQQIERAQGTFAVALVLAILFPAASIQGEVRVKIAEDRISFALQDGWMETDLNADTVLAGFATMDNRSSAFFKEMDPSFGGSMQDLIDGTVANFEQRFDVKKVGEAKTGRVQGPGEKKWPAIFTTAEAIVKKGREEFEMRFYLLVFDTGEHLYFLQASTTMPVRESREEQIYAMIRSIVAKS